MSAHITPLEVCEALFGGIEQIGAISGKHIKTPYSWRHAAVGRDAGDFPSTVILRELLDHSDNHKLGLTAEHLIRGAQAEEIAAILAARVPMAVRAAE